MNPLKHRIESLPDELTVADIAKAFRKAAKRFCGDQNLSLDNAAQIRCVSNMAANTIWDLILKDREAANERARQYEAMMELVDSISFTNHKPSLDHIGKDCWMVLPGAEVYKTALKAFNSLDSEGGR